jgi:hypothetical protein
MGIVGGAILLELPIAISPPGAAPGRSIASTAPTEPAFSH